MADKFRDPQAGGSLILAWQATNKTVLIVGGGTVAAGRAFNALEADANVVIVAPDINAELQYRVDRDQVSWRSRKFEDTDLEGADMVLTAISDAAESRRIVGLCRHLRIPVNAADINDLCDFWFMSTHRDHSVQIAVSTNSKAPRLANRIRRQVAAALPRGTGLAVEQIGRLRKRIREADPKPENSKRRMAWLMQLCDYWPIEQLANLDSDNIDSLLEAYVRNDAPQTISIAQDLASLASSEGVPSPVLHGQLVPDSAITTQPLNGKQGKLTLVGAGVGDPELLTVRAHRAL
ncbi:uroporphyrin-III C-methyltransferase, partial [Coemansia furcata]